MFNRIVILINIVVGLWWGSIYVYIFYHIRQGTLIGEPNKVIAEIEY